MFARPYLVITTDYLSIACFVVDIKKLRELLWSKSRIRALGACDKIA